MKIFIKNKLISFGGSSTAVDESGNKVFKIKGKWVLFSPTKKKKIYDKNGKLLYIVRNKWFNWWNTRAFIFDANKQKIATVKNNFNLSNGAKFIVEDFKDEISFDGELLSRQLKILRNGEVAGTLSKEFTIVRDAFCLDASEEDLPILTALVIAIDNISDKNSQK